MARHHCKNANMNSQENIPPSDPVILSDSSPQKHNITEDQDKDITIAIMIMFKDLQWDANKSLNEVCECTNSRMK